MIDPTIADLLSKIDSATTAVAARIQSLIDKANNAGQLTSAEIAAALQPEVDRLTALGSDPDNPVPSQG